MYPQKDIDKVRSMAEQIMELATSDEYETRRERWRAVNGLRKPDRAPVWCGMAGVSRELFKPETLECTDDTCRKIEDTFRRRLYKQWVGDDEIFEPWWGVGAVFDCSSEHTYGLPTRISLGTTSVGGFKYYHPIETEDDYEKITVPTFTYNPEKTSSRLSQMEEILGDVMPVRLTCSPPSQPGQGNILEHLRGMEQMLGDLALRPDLVHRAMAKLTEGILGGMRVAEETGLLTPNNFGPMTCSDPLNHDGGNDGKPGGSSRLPGNSNGDSQSTGLKLNNLWGQSASQEFQMVSPQMQEEFLLNYQIPCFQQYGAVQYGCCEDLTHKIEIVKRIPNLRIFVCSYWTDLDKLLKACGTDYTIMWRQLSAHVMLPDELDDVRKTLDEGMRKLKGSYYQVILREVETLNGHPDRLKEWAEIAMKMAEKHA